MTAARRRTLFQLLALPVVIYALVVLGLYALQRRFVFDAATARPVLADAGIPAAREIRIRTADGLDLVGWYLPPPRPRAPVILFFHGGAGSIGNCGGVLQWAVEQGYGALVPEYRGYGGNPGHPSEAGLEEDARAAFARLRAEGVPADRIVLYGQSLGTGVAVHLAGEQKVAALILEMPFTSLVDAAQSLHPLIPVRRLLWDRFDSLGTIGRVHVPLLIGHGAKDRIVPLEEGQALFAAANEPKQIWVAPEGIHGGLTGLGFDAVMVGFIRRVVEEGG